MTRVREIQSYINAFCDLPGAEHPIFLEVSRPWHFGHSPQEGQVQFAADGGIYIYSAPGDPWNVEMQDNDQPVWYIGKSDRSLAARVWAHMGNVYEPGTSEVCDPPFKYHRWAQIDGVPLDVKGALAAGNVVVYTIRTDPVGSPPGIPLALEKFLLSCSFRVHGALPPLNVDL